MGEKPVIFNIQQGCIHDGPGVRTVIFFSGCALNCAWCANPEALSIKPQVFVVEGSCIGCGSCIKVCNKNAVTLDSQGKIRFDRAKCAMCGRCVEVCCAGARAMTGKFYTAEELIEMTKKDMPFFKKSGGGITFSGGEAALWPETVRTVAKWYRENGCSTSIETCGFAPWENYAKILPYIDTALFDIKIWDREKHKKYCGEGNERIYENLKRIIATNDVVIRMPIIPGINDSREELCQIAAYLRSLGKIRKVHILPYHRLGVSKYKCLGKDYTLPDILPPSRDHMEEIKLLIEGYGFDTVIGG